MEPKKKLGIGAVFAVFGGLGVVLAPTLGLTALGQPWSFLVGFVMGVIASIGAILSIGGLIASRQNR